MSTQEQEDWYSKAKPLLDTLTLYDLGLRNQPPTLPKRWCISCDSPTIPVFLEETPIIPFWYGVEKTPKPWWRNLLDSIRRWC